MNRRTGSPRNFYMQHESGARDANTHNNQTQSESKAFVHMQQPHPWGWPTRNSISFVLKNVRFAHLGSIQVTWVATTEVAKTAMKVSSEANGA